MMDGGGELRGTVVTVDDLLNDRGKTHGDFRDNARTAQRLRRAFRDQPGWLILTDIQREALDMVAGKISRILSGQGDFHDHWDDIMGYARLARNGGN